MYVYGVGRQTRTVRIAIRPLGGAPASGRQCIYLTILVAPANYLK